MSQCNRCTLRGIERRAKARGQTVTTRSSSFGGVDVFVHEPERLPPTSATPDDPAWAAWLMELPRECTC